MLQIAASTKLVCHMTNWSQYRPTTGKFTPENIDPFLCTHVIYALATINSFNQVAPIEWNDETLYSSLNNLKNVLRTRVTVYIVSLHPSRFIGMVSKPEGRQAFIKSAISYLRSHGFDGLNLAWEFPTQNGSPSGDRERFTELVRELQKAFENDAKDTRLTQLLLSANVAALQPTIISSYEVAQIASSLDFINVMTYDFHGHWERATGHNSPLFRSSHDSGTHYHFNDSAITYWLDNGAPAEKLLMGFPTYGRTYRLTTSNTGLGAPTNGPADAGPYTRDAGYWSYYEVCSFTSGATIEWIDEQKVPYAVKGSSWVGYDSKESYAAKVQWLKTKNLGGASVWTLDMDDFSGAFCAEGPFPLVNHLRNSLGFAPKPTTTRAPTTTPDPILSFCSGRPDGLYVNIFDSTTYFQCFRGNTYLHKCQPGLVYVDACKCCNWP
uniref:chitinase n=1 Tax=Salmo trutta TaxID=8032 RepID=A0A673Z834_SALTR